MGLYTTPLQLGYFFALLMALIFWVRSYREQRLSDFFLGLLFLLLASEIQDYTFGFAGINFLWEEMNGFPRNTSLLVGPVFYFYLQSQTNYRFSFRKKHLLHFLPYVIYFVFDLSIFLQGSYTVQEYQQTTLANNLGLAFWIAILISFFYYFYQSIKRYKAYRVWATNNFSNTELIDFKWFRNFIYILISCFTIKTIFQVSDVIMDLDFDEDWYWNLVIVGTIFYIGLTAYSQKQGELFQFDNQPKKADKSEGKSKEDFRILLSKLDRIMEEDRLYLQPELNLSSLAKHLKVNNNQLSACINQEKKSNFNDYINSLRIAAFEENVRLGKNKNFTLLALAFDCGFNSKATFNRAFKKEKGITPNQYLKGISTFNT